MPSMSTTYTFSTGTVIDSLQMNQNFIDVKLAYNTYAVQTDGTVQATTNSLGTGIVTTAKLADLNVTTAKLVDLGVTTGKIADLAVTAAKIADLTVTEAKIADSSITSAKIVDGTIVNADIASGAAIALTKLGSGTAAISISGSAASATTATTATNVAYSGLTGSVPTWNQNTTGTAAVATNVAASGITGMGKGSSTTTLYNSNGSFSFAHGLGYTPSTVIAVNGDYGAHPQALTLYAADATYIIGRFLNTTTNPAVRINWIAFQ
jgi:hypothetical protein